MKSYLYWLFRHCVPPWPIRHSNRDPVNVNMRLCVALLIYALRPRCFEMQILSIGQTRLLLPPAPRVYFAGRTTHECALLAYILKQPAASTSAGLHNISRILCIQILAFPRPHSWRGSRGAAIFLLISASSFPVLPLMHRMLAAPCRLSSHLCSDPANIWSTLGDLRPTSRELFPGPLISGKWGRPEL